MKHRKGPLQSRPKSEVVFPYEDVRGNQKRADNKGEALHQTPGFPPGCPVRL